MGWIQKNLILAIVIAAMVAVISGLSAVVVRQSGKLGAMNAEFKRQKRDLDQSVADLGTLQLAFDAQKAAHEKCLDGVKISQADNTAAVEKITEFNNALRATSGEIRAIRDRIYVEASCNALATMDINALCPALAGSLRQRAAQANAPH